MGRRAGTQIPHGGTDGGDVEGVRSAGLGVRGEGGYVVAPPSSTSRAYRWIDRSPPASVSWLIGCLKAATSAETLF